MNNQPRLFDLAFISPRRRPRTAPEIVFIVDKLYLDELNKRLHILRERYADYADEYCLQNTSFTLPEQDLWGNCAFGFGCCGYCTIENNDAWLRLPLGTKPSNRHSTLTIHLLSIALGVSFEETLAQTNQEQLIQVQTSVNDSGLHAHAIGGFLSPSVIAYVSEYAKARKDEGSEYSATSPEVLKAMRETWYAVSEEEMRWGAKDVRGHFSTGGHFGLGCFGNACDIGVYPDHEIDPVDELGSSEFSAHNLDSPEQQLTLLAGLAKLCELVRAKTT